MDDNDNQEGTVANQIGEDATDNAACRKLDFEVASNQVNIKTTENLAEKIPETGTVQKSASPTPSKWKLKARCRAINADDGKGKKQIARSAAGAV